MKKRNEPHDAPSREFALWKTITLGVRRDARALLKDLEENGFTACDDAVDIMAKPAFAVARRKTKIGLVIVSVGDLGFTEATPLRDIYRQARKIGLKLCPAEAGPQFRLQYGDQPCNEWLRVAMKAITGADGRPHVFRVAHDGDGRWLDAPWANPNCTWSPRSSFLFRR